MNPGYYLAFFDAEGESQIMILGEPEAFAELVFRNDACRGLTWNMDGDCWSSVEPVVNDAVIGTFGIMYWTEDDLARNGY